MKRNFTSYSVTDFEKFKSQLLNFGKRFGNFCFLDNHEYEFDKSYECLAAAGSLKSITSDKETGLQRLKQFQNQHKDWIFGHVSYDLKNEIEELVSENRDEIEFPDLHFFVPEIVVILSKEKVEISSFAAETPDDIFNSISQIDLVPPSPQKILFQAKFSREEYLETVKKLQQHIA